MIALAGCGPAADPPKLLAARFVDENQDGLPQPGESILLTFSGPVRLVPQALRGAGLRGKGVRLQPPEHFLGNYHLESATVPEQLRVVLGHGGPAFWARGMPGSGETTTLWIEYGELAGLLHAQLGGEFPARSSAVPIALQPHGPALLRSVEWVDVDRDHTVTAGDELRLTFARSVRLADGVKREQARVPADLFLLPRAGDRLSDGTQPARLREDLRNNALCIVLGSRPRLTIVGEFDLDQREPEASALAVNGTLVRPHPALVDVFGSGVASDRFLDVTPAGECAPFRPIPAFPGLSGELRGHTATALPDGRAVVVGGGIDRPLADVWIWEQDGSWGVPLSLKQPRQWHSAHYLPGDDGLPGTSDDAVIVVGGFDGEKALASIEVILPASDPPQVLPVTDISGVLAPRYYHTGHTRAAGPPSRIVLVGGQRNRAELGAALEELEVRVAYPPGALDPEVRVAVRPLGLLRYPRTRHASGLLLYEGREVLLVLGGWGANAFDKPSVPFPIDDPHFVLCHPELLDLDQPGPTVLAAPGPLDRRRDLHLLPLDTGELLLVGGTAQPLRMGEGWGPTRPLQDTRLAYRLRVSAQDKALALEAQQAGSLNANRHALTPLLLGDGSWLLVGGSEGAGSTQRVERFLPTVDDFAPFCDQLRVPREHAQAVLVAGGDWLIIGGSGPGPDDAIELLRATP